MSTTTIDDFTVTGTLHTLPCEGCIHQAHEAISYARSSSSFIQERAEEFRNEHGFIELRHYATVAFTKVYQAAMNLVG